jgi:3-hydroxyisobutyrate dehydrogenase
MLRADAGDPAGGGRQSKTKRAVLGGALMAKIGFLGAGNMGAAMIPNLLKGGHDVTVYNRTLEKARPLEKLGARLAATPKAAVEGADAIISIVIDDKASRAVWTGKDGALEGAPKPGALAIESSTVSNAWIMELAKLAEAKGLHFMDIAVAGRPDAAVKAQLNAFAGGSVEDFERAKPIFSSMCKSITRFGGVGKGNAFKLIYNTMGVIQVVAAVEGMYAAEAAGIELDAAAEAFSVGNTNSGHVIRHTAYVASGKHENPVHFSGRNRLKDVSYGVEFIEKIGAQSELGHAAASVLNRMIDLGMGDKNDSELIDALRKIHGTH